ncbi:MAG: glycosyltransferase [Promethearchaeota archaeon]
MQKLKINIIFQFKTSAWGGGNQFLNALKKEFIKRGLYERDPNKANCYIFNSHHNLIDVLRLKLKYQDKLFIHRIDGIMTFHRKKGKRIDKKIYKINKLIANGTIFQSLWSKSQSYKNGMRKTCPDTVIINAPDNRIFYPKELEKTIIKENEFCKLIAVSWSINKNKGFDLYQYLDRNLNYDRYSMIFVGNSPIKFENIKHIKSVNPKKVADLLRMCDIYITGAKKEACSNSLLEALACGLPCVAIHDASNPEILKGGGETFHKFPECINKIELIRNNYNLYKSKIKLLKIDEIADLYLKFIKILFPTLKLGKKRLTIIQYYYFLIKNIFFQHPSLQILKDEIYWTIKLFKSKFIRGSL